MAHTVRDQPREDAKAKMTIHSDYLKKLTKGTPILYVREGNNSDELLRLIDEKKGTSVIVLSAYNQSEIAGT